MLGVLPKLLYLLSIGPFSAEGFPTEGGERLGGNDHRNSNDLDEKLKDSSKYFSTPLLTKDQDDHHHPLKIMAFPRLDFQSKSPNSLETNKEMSHRIRKRGVQFTLDFSKPFDIDLTKRIFQDQDDDDYEDPYEFEAIKKLKLQLAQAKKKKAEEDAKSKSQVEPEIELLVDSTEMKSFKIYRDITMLLVIHSSVLAIFSTWDYFQNSDLVEWQTYAYYGKRIAAFYWLSTLMFAYAHLLTEEGDLYMIKVWTGLGVISFATAVIFTVMGSEDWEEFNKTEDKPHSSLFID